MSALIEAVQELISSVEEYSCPRCGEDGGHDEDCAFNIEVNKVLGELGMRRKYEDWRWHYYEDS